MRTKFKVGDVFQTNCGVDAKIIEIGLGRRRVKIVWLDDVKHESIVTSSNLRTGKVYNPYVRSVRGIGFLGWGKYRASTHTRHHRSWIDMFKRCYSKEFQRDSPTYAGCSVNEAWHCFQDFAAWCDTQAGFGEPFHDLDKDLICTGNKEYSPENCRFVPRYLNTLVGDSKAARGSLPLGVHLHKISKKVNPFVAQVNVSYLGKYNTAQEAHRVWQEAKATAIELAVHRYASEKSFDTLVADSLMRRVWDLRNFAFLGLETKSL